MKRFYKDVAIGGARGARTILLDGRGVRTPKRAPLALGSDALAEAVAGEWRAQDDRVDPRTMPMTGLANAAIDQVAPDPVAFARPIGTYGESDLLCYRAEGPASLVARQAAAWDPPLAWARSRYDVGFEIVAGIVHRAQPEATVRRLAEAVTALPPFSLVTLSTLVTITGSLVLALMHEQGAIDAEAVWTAGTVDEAWQSENWGEDDLAIRASEARRADLMAAARFLALAKGG